MSAFVVMGCNYEERDPLEQPALFMGWCFGAEVTGFLLWGKKWGVSTPPASSKAGYWFSAGFGT